MIDEDSYGQYGPQDEFGGYDDDNTADADDLASEAANAVNSADYPNDIYDENPESPYQMGIMQNIEDTQTSVHDRYAEMWQSYADEHGIDDTSEGATGEDLPAEAAYSAEGDAAGTEYEDFNENLG